jgi:hypothetical protein
MAPLDLGIAASGNHGYTDQHQGNLDRGTLFHRFSPLPRFLF